jgi:hypothetical protein
VDDNLVCVWELVYENRQKNYTENIEYIIRNKEISIIFRDKYKY